MKHEFELRLLSKTSDESVIKRQDQIPILESISSNLFAKRFTFQYIEQNFDELIEKYSNLILFFNLNIWKIYLTLIWRFGGSFTFYNLLESITKTFNTRYELERVEKLLKISKNITVELSNKITENIANNIRWMDKNMNSFKQWLRNSI